MPAQPIPIDQSMAVCVLGHPTSCQDCTKRQGLPLRLVCFGRKLVAIVFDIETGHAGRARRLAHGGSGGCHERRCQRSRMMDRAKAQSTKSMVRFGESRMG